MTKIIMTNSVIRQVTILVIAYFRHKRELSAMIKKPKPELPSDLARAMRPEEIGKRLRILRTALGMSPSQMADDLGIERTYWSRFEKGNRPLTDTFAALLVAKHGVTLDFLILGKWDKLPLDLSNALRDAEKR